MNYYNEHDPKAAAWLRELITQGLIPNGHVDTRSITEIQPHELTNYTQCHFFAGIGGWSLALQLAGWPATKPVWTGSCPCQPFSSAGKQLAQADERHLWPVFFKLIAECRPEFVFGEQVASAIGKGWLDGISSDLEGVGYASGAAVLGAHSVGAPHIRQRLYWVADASSAGCEGRKRDWTTGTQRTPSRYACECGSIDGLADSTGFRHQREQDTTGETGRTGVESIDCGLANPQSGGQRIDGSTPRETGHADECCTGGGLADARSVRCNTGLTGDGRGEESTGRQSGEVSDRRCGLGDSQQPGLEGHAGNGDGGNKPGRNDADPARPAPKASSDCRLPDTSSDMGGCGKHQQERGTQGRASDRRTDAWSRFELIPCADGKARRIEPGLAPLAHGIPARVVRLRGYGNAIVPQVAAEFITAFLES
jgi:DNA (cytosine-5)-methyltransferase 1